MSSVDRMWLRMDDPTNLMMITGVMLFDEPLERGDVLQVLEERLLTIPRFAQRVHPGQRGARHFWAPDPALDLDWHLQEVELDPPGDDRTLQGLVSRLMSTPLDLSRPLWQIHLIQGYGRGSATLWRLHHCIGDGMALMLALLSLTDLTGVEGPAASPTDPLASGNPLRALFSPHPPSAEEAKAYLERVLPEAVRLLCAPTEKLRQLSRWRKGGASVPALGKLTLRPPDARTLFKGSLGTAKRAAWSNPIAMAEVAEVRRRLGGTVNDVLTNAVAGGLRHYLEGRGALRSGLSLRAVVPVNLRPLEEMHSLGNQFGLVFLSLPVGLKDPRARLAELRRRMNKLKRSLEPVVALKIMSALGASPRRIQELVVRIFGTKGTAVLTNVPGPTQSLRFAGQVMNGLMFWVPQSARLGMGVSILSYAGQVRVGVATDAGLVPDPETIIAGFEREFHAMSRLPVGREGEWPAPTAASSTS